ncbi:MAG: hemin uptake protein HemP [Burkholderiales bacterium]|nr:hemin uptake protein HemP [Nitrosomonas sp.]MCP5276495.1 hemin uptake protein HemP [Burkholderiales bacterium]
MGNSVKISAQPDIPVSPHLTALPVQGKIIDSSTLFTQGNIVLIQHRGDCYVLRRTRNGKLILTK